MPYVAVEGEQIYYTTGGARTNCASLLVIHGAGGDHRHWPDELRAIPTTDCMVVDLPGHGKSGGSGRHSVAAYADFVESLIAALQMEPLTLIGHSMGGAIVMTLGLRHNPWLHRMVLVGSGAKLRVEDEILSLLDADYPKAVDLICSRAFGETISRARLEQYRLALRQTSPEVARNDYLACNDFDLMEEVSDIHLPTLIVSGAKDQLTPLKYGSYLQDRIRGSLHKIIPDAGHMMALEKPDDFIEAVAAFVA